MFTTTTKSTKTLYNKTPLQENLHTGLKSGRYGPLSLSAPTNPAQIYSMYYI